MRDNTAIRPKYLFVALLSLSVLGLSENGQSIASAQDAAGGDGSAGTSGIRFSLDANSRFGTLTYVPDKWGEFHLRLENDGDTSQQLLCTSYFVKPNAVTKDAPELQFVRDVWLPPHSRLLVPHPVLLPGAEWCPDNQAAMISLVIDRSKETEVLIKSDSGRLEHKRTLLVSPTNRHTGVIGGWDTDEAIPQDILDLIVACRVYQGLNNRLTFLAGQFLPTDETS